MEVLLTSVSAPAAGSSAIGLIAALEAEAAAVCGSLARVESACAALRELRSEFGDPSVSGRVPALARLAGARVSPANALTAQLLCELSDAMPDPWPVVDALLDARDPHVVALALDTLARHAACGAVSVDERIVDALASRVVRDSGPFQERAPLEAIAKILAPRGAGTAALEALCTGAPAMHMRRFAARLLDLDGSLPSATLAAELLGGEDAAWLAGYLAWSRATHLDLVTFASGEPARAVDSLRKAETICGEKLLREVIAAVGWPNLNLGMYVETYAGVSVGGSFPLLVRTSDESLLAGIESTRKVFDRLLFTAYGGEATSASASRGDSIARFRAYNLAHADALADFLDVRPLTREKVAQSLERMDRIVASFELLFDPFTDECPALDALYRELKGGIAMALEAEQQGNAVVSAELTRLVDMFEDPASLSEVHTLHGLKRYLHQRGLKLGMRLAESGGGANRTVTLALASGGRLAETVHAIEYVDFEPEAGAENVPPYAVRVVERELARQLVHAQQRPPKVKVFCYGNEVHYFVAYRNHPAFVRIDWSPPARGGMIDLAYFGVSKYELDAHPAPSLPAIQLFFKRLDFDISIENTHVHARYDKERAFDLGDICAKAAGLFRLVPYLMDVDWVIGDVELSAAARAEVAAAWADIFATWGVLPYAQLLTSDRRGILASIERDAAGEHEARWNGSGGYRDRFSPGQFDGFWDAMRERARERGLGEILPVEGSGPVTQLAFEERVLNPLERARARGEIDASGRPVPPARFRRRHAADCLADVLQSSDETCARSSLLADTVAMLARGLRFRTIGAINGYDVQSAFVPLPGHTLGLYVLRDGGGIPRIALHGDGEMLHASRGDASDAWTESWTVDPEPLVVQLRRANYPLSGSGVLQERPNLELFRTANPHAASPLLAGERVLEGIAASPGRATGPARLGIAGRRPADVDGAVVVCPSMSPADGAFLASSAGVVSTGGGALSHAGLLALQYEKPALIVGGTWIASSDAPPVLTVRTTHYEERSREAGVYRISERHHLRETEERLRDGDILVLDADQGLLRILGNEADALALHHSLAQLGDAARQLSTAQNDSEVLAQRGRRLRACHQLERVLGRLRDPILARHAVWELLLHENSGAGDKEQLLAVLLANGAVSVVARTAIHAVAETIVRRFSAASEEAMRLIPASEWPWEILSLRLDALKLRTLVESMKTLVAGAGAALCDSAGASKHDLDSAATRRLRRIREELIRRADDAGGMTDVARLRHVIEEVDRIDLVLGADACHRADVARLYHFIAIHDREVRRHVIGRRTVDSEAGGIELREIAGSKAANLAQTARLGEGALVPPWFVVTDRTFREALEAPVTSAGQQPQNVREAIDRLVATADLTVAQKSSLIRDAWERAQLPPQLIDSVRSAYAELAARSGLEEPFVAVRSSAAEEDLESAARAGEFDTFLFVRGADAVVAHVRRAWSGLWSERALRHRAAFGSAMEIGGGVVVQVMVASRVSGVLHTVNVAERRPREMVINAGLGLGEGIVSGAVAADRIVVSKEGDLQSGELRFRYVTAEKRERVVFNSRVGFGTARVETLYHQRLRPALEYVEICELVRAAARLEAAYGYPLDIEFAIEGTSLRLLQVRPIPTPFAVWRDTVERFPLSGEGGTT